MTKQEYLTELERALKSNNVQDVEDILDEYEQHFAFKLADGYTEEEITARLEKPQELAKQFASGAEKSKPGRKGLKAILAIGLAFFDIIAAMFFILLLSWVIVMGALAVASAALGICLTASLNIAAIIPVMPYWGGILSGISFLGLSVVTAVGTIYCYLFFRQLIRAYGRWHKNTLNVSAGPVYPPLSKYPAISAKLKRRLRSIIMIALVVFGLFLVLALFVLFAYTGFKPFWHELGWFNYGR
ncbi:MAG: DUF1700 domain-containing protein [Christensenellales bacterium]